jgi:hypothetical protein
VHPFSILAAGRQKNGQIVDKKNGQNRGQKKRSKSWTKKRPKSWTKKTVKIVEMAKIWSALEDLQLEAYVAVHGTTAGVTISERTPNAIREESIKDRQSLAIELGFDARVLEQVAGDNQDVGRFLSMNGDKCGDKVSVPATQAELFLNDHCLFESIHRNCQQAIDRVRDEVLSVKCPPEAPISAL